jgi:putative endonuclease
MTAYTYILRCGDGSYYVGSTTNLEPRFDAHVRGLGGDYTSRRLPVTLVWAGEFDSISSAFAFEHQVKGWRREKKEALIAGRFDLLPELSRTAKPRVVPMPEDGLRQAQAPTTGRRDSFEPMSPDGT